MKSKWSHLKDTAITARKHGISIRAIEIKFGIPRSTLSGWFKDVLVSEYYKNRLQKKRIESLENARKMASIWHSQKKEERQVLAKQDALSIINKLGKDLCSLELGLAMLYLGEGAKREKGLVLGNSNPEVLKFFISALLLLYKIDLKRLRCELHLRKDQNSKKEILYWAKTLNIPSSSFKGIYVDRRTDKTLTYPEYHGVCIISYNDVAIQRKLMYLYQLYCQQTIQNVLRG